MNDRAFLLELKSYIENAENLIDAEFGLNRTFDQLALEEPDSIPGIYYEVLDRLEAMDAGKATSLSMYEIQRSVERHARSTGQPLGTQARWIGEALFNELFEFAGSGKCKVCGGESDMLINFSFSEAYCQECYEIRKGEIETSA